MESFQEKYGPWALVTGASSGIGAEFCRQLAARGLNLVLVARRQKRMETLSAELTEKHAVKTKIIPADLSQDDFMSHLQPVIEELDIGLLVNNAGFGISGEFLTSELERELALVKVNCRAPLILTHTLGNRMMERKKGGIIFLSSVLGYIPTPYFAHYAASKAFNLFLGEALWYELKWYGIDAVSLAPGTTRTEFGTFSGYSGVLAMETGPVVAECLKNLGRKPVVVAGTRNKVSAGVLRLSPRKVMIRLFGWVMAHRKKIARHSPWKSETAT